MSKHYGKIVSLLATSCILVNAETIASPDLNIATPAAESIAPQTVESTAPQTQDNAQITPESTPDIEKLVANSEETTEKSAPQKKEKPKKTRTRKAKKSNSKPFWMFWKSEEAYKKELEAKRNGTYVERKKKAKRKKRAEVKAESVKAPEENYESLWGPTVLFDADFEMHENTYAIGIPDNSTSRLWSNTFNISNLSDDLNDGAYSSTIFTSKPNAPYTADTTTKSVSGSYRPGQYGFNNAALVAYSSISNDTNFFLSTALINTPGWKEHRTLAKFHIEYGNYFFMISNQINNKDPYFEKFFVIPGFNNDPFYEINNIDSYQSFANSAIPLTFGLKTTKNNTHILTINLINSNFYVSTVSSETLLPPGKAFELQTLCDPGACADVVVFPEDGYTNLKPGDLIYHNPYYNTTTFSFASTIHGFPWANHKGDYQPINNILGFDILTGASVSFATYKLPPQNIHFYALKGPSKFHYFDEWGKEQESDTQTKRDLRSKINQIEATLSASLEVKGLMRLGTAYPQIKELDGFDLGVGLKVAMGDLLTGLSRYDPARRWVTPPTMLSVDITKPDGYGKSYISMTYTYARYEEFVLDKEKYIAGTYDDFYRRLTTGSTLKHHINRQNRFAFGIGRTITI